MEGVASDPKSPQIEYDQFDDHPFSYPYMISAFDSSSSSANDSPTTTQPPISSISPPSRRSSRTSWETSWFDEEGDDMMAGVEPYGTEQEPPHHQHNHSKDDFTRYQEDSAVSFTDGKPSPLMQCNDSVMQGDEMAEGAACQFDDSDWFAQFDGQLDISDEPPSRDALDTAGDIPIYDSAGGQRPFKSLFARGDVVGDRQLIVFIRHFYCGVCIP